MLLDEIQKIAKYCSPKKSWHVFIRKRLLKKLAAGRIDGLPAGRQPDLVVFGHDHLPAAEWVDGTLYLNPGTAASPHEEDDDPTIAIVSVEPTGLSVTFVPLVRSEEALTG